MSVELLGFINWLSIVSSLLRKNIYSGPVVYYGKSGLVVRSSGEEEVEKCTAGELQKRVRKGFSMSMWFDNAMPIFFMLLKRSEILLLSRQSQTLQDVETPVCEKKKLMRFYFGKSGRRQCLLVFKALFA